MGQLAGGADPGQVGRRLVDQAPVAALGEGPRQRIAGGELEGHAQVRVVALEDREQVGIDDRVVRVAPRHAGQQFAGVSGRVLGPGQAWHLATLRGQRLHVARLGHHLDPLASQIGNTARTPVAHPVDQALAHALVGRAERHVLRPIGGDGQARGGHVGPAGLDCGQQVAEAAHLDDLQLHAQPVRKAAHQVVVGALGPCLADEVGDRAVPGDHAQLARCPDLVQQGRGRAATQEQRRQQDDDYRSHGVVASGTHPPSWPCKRRREPYHADLPPLQSWRLCSRASAYV